MVSGKHHQTTRNVGIWIRVSTQDQARGESPQNHKFRAEQYAAFKEWNVSTVYDLSGVSGKGVLEHPEAKRMLDDVRTGKIDALIFSKLARLARNTRELLDIADHFHKYDASLVSLHESFDTSTPAGRMFYTMIAAMAQWEREEISDRVSAAAVTRAKQGKCVGGAPPYGYQWKDGELLPHPDEAPVRVLMYELFTKLERKNAVAKELTRRGFRTRRGGKFSIQSVDLILRDPTAKGLRRSYYTKEGSKPGSVELRPESEWEWHECPAIVTPEQWDHCNVILERHRNGKAPGPRGKYLFAGKVVCANDRNKMYVLNESPKFVCKKCRNKIPQDDVEAIFRDQLQTFFASEDEITKILHGADAEIGSRREQISLFERERVSVIEDRDRVMRGYLDDKISADRWGEAEQLAEKRIAEIDAGIAGLEGELVALTINQNSNEEIVHNARDLYGRWDKLSFEEKRTIIEAITDEVVVGDRDIEIRLHYLPVYSDDGEAMKNTFSLLPSGSRK